MLEDVIGNMRRIVAANLAPPPQSNISVKPAAMRKKEAELFVNGAEGRTPSLRTRRQTNGHAKSDPRQVLRPTTRQDIWVTQYENARRRAILEDGH